MTTDALLSTGGNLTPSHAAPLHVTVPPAALPGTAVFQKKKNKKKTTLHSQGALTVLLSTAGVGRWLPQMSNFECSTKDIWDPVG